MKRLVGLAICALTCSNAFAKNTRLKVTVIENLPKSASYNWQVAGKATVSCDSSSCSSYYTPPSSGTANVQGAVLKLLLPDGRIVIAECVAKENTVADFLIAATGNEASTTYRSCKAPAANSTIDAEFNRSQVKLFMREPSIDGTGRMSSETYYIKGVLQPGAGMLQPEAENKFVSMVNRFNDNEAELGKRADSWTAKCEDLSTDLKCLLSQQELITASLSLFRTEMSAIDDWLSHSETNGATPAERQQMIDKRKDMEEMSQRGSSHLEEVEAAIKTAGHQ